VVADPLRTYTIRRRIFTAATQATSTARKNGAKLFWSRGNGWVLGGFARVLPYMPADYPSRAKYVMQFREMVRPWRRFRRGRLVAKRFARRRSLSHPRFPAPRSLRSLSPGESTKGSSIARRMSLWWRRHGRVCLTHIYADGRLGSIQKVGAARRPESRRKLRVRVVLFCWPVQK
jgi:hypothetical protein